jgi:Cu(I)/Ag(I) efflux system membrane fusion protein
MKTKAVIAAMAFLCAAGGYGLYRVGLSQGLKNAAASPGATSAAGGKVPVAAERKPLYWQDPMNPGQKFDKPGKSPFMDMQLVPVYADDDAGDGGKVGIDSRLQQNLGLRTAEVTRGTLVASLVAVGSVAYNEREIALVQARANGYLERLYVRAALDPVRKGQMLADLYVPDWIAAQEEFLTVKHMQGSGMESLLDGARQRMRLSGMSDEQIRLVESTGKVHPRITLTAPAGGVLAELSVREGMTVTAGAPMFRINGLDTVWVNAEVPESQAAQVRPGTGVEARAAALPGMVFKGKVSALLPQVNAATRTLTARIELANPHAELVPGMFAGVIFNPSQQGEVLLVPSEAVIQTGTRSVVILAQDGGKFLPVDVETGREANGQTEVRKGLQAGQKIVVSGQFLIDSEASLKGTATRMSDPATDRKDAGAAK